LAQLIDFIPMASNAPRDLHSGDGGDVERERTAAEGWRAKTSRDLTPPLSLTLMRRYSARLRDIVLIASLLRR